MTRAQRSVARPEPSGPHHELMPAQPQSGRGANRFPMTPSQIALTGASRPQPVSEGGSEISGWRTLNGRTERMGIDGEQQNEPGHRITSSARSRIDSGIAMPSAFAVLRLTTSSYCVGCSIGRSAGLAPFRILSTYCAERRNKSPKFGPHRTSMRLHRRSQSRKRRWRVLAFNGAYRCFVETKLVQAGDGGLHARL
jgi:hypothetical protein